jgi:tetratricopeptide (TPR) repeat protein
MTIAQKLQFCFLLVLTYQISFAQDNTINYGESPDDCKKQLTIMVTYHKQKAYDSAAKYWRWCFNNCPQGSKNIYIVGEKIFNQKIKESKDNKELRAAYIDTLLKIYDYRIKYFPGKTATYKYKTLGKKGKTIATYQSKEKYEEAYNILDTVINKLGNNVSSGVASAYMFTVKKMMWNNKLNCSDMILAYTKVLNIVNANMDKKPKSFKRVKEKAINTADKCLNCDLLDSLFKAGFDKLHIDTTWLDGGIELLLDKRCTKSTILVKMMEKRYETCPSAKTAIKLAQYFGSKGDNAKATQFFKEGISMESDSTKLVRYYLKNASFLNNSGKASSGISMARKALAIEPDNAKAYLIMGDAIIYGASSCKDLKLGGSEIYWVAVDYYNKAALLVSSPEIKNKALKNANKYAEYFPLTNAIFMDKNIEEGGKYKVGCWINTTTTVRHKK